MFETTTAWPEGVIARYLTVAGASLSDPDLTVDVTAGAEKQVRDEPGYRLMYPWKTSVAHLVTCRACDYTHTEEGAVRSHTKDYLPDLERRALDRALSEAKTQAQSHAEVCRALPKPEGV